MIKTGFVLDSIRKLNSFDAVSYADIAATVSTSIINIILAALLLVAISKNKAVYCLPWLIVTAIELIAGLIYLIYYTVPLSTKGEWTKIGSLLGICIPAFGMIYQTINKFCKL